MKEQIDKIKVVFIVFFLMLDMLSNISAQTYSWPTDVNAETNRNRINGTIGEFRSNSRFHGGIDFSRENGRNIYAMTTGVLTGPFPNSTSVNRYMKIISNDQARTLYIHTDNSNCSTCAASGTTVAIGDKIGRMVTQANIHLHLEHYDGGNLLESLSGFEDLQADPNCDEHVLAFSDQTIQSDGINFRYDGLRSNTSTLIYNNIINQRRLLFGKVDIEIHVSDPRISNNGLPYCAGNRVAPNSFQYSLFTEEGLLIEGHEFEFFTIPNDANGRYVFSPLSVHPGNPSIHIITSHPYDTPHDRYWNTSLKRNISQSWPAINHEDYDMQNARDNSESFYSDGSLIVNIQSSDTDTRLTHNTVQENINVLIDNFLPYVQKVEVINISGLPVLQQIWNFNTTTGLIEYVDIPMSAGTDLVLPRLRLTFSEEMEQSTVQVTLRNENNTVILDAPIITDSDVYTYPINLSSESLGLFQEYCLEIEGQDLATNELLSFSQLIKPLNRQSLQVSSRDFADQDDDDDIAEWYPVLPQGADETHCFFLGMQNFCPLVDNSQEGKPIASNNSNISDRNLPFVSHVLVRFGDDIAYDMDWQCALIGCGDPQTNEIFITPFGGVTTQNLDISYPMIIEVTTSEPVENLEGEVYLGNTAFEMIHFSGDSPNQHTFTVFLPSNEIETYGEISQGDFIRMEFTGKDRSDNPLMNLELEYHPDNPAASDDCVQLPYKDVEGIWQNPEMGTPGGIDIVSGVEKAHHFGLLNTCSDEFQNEDDNNKSFTTGGGTNDCLIADFEFNFSYDGCTVNFIDYSIGNGISYQWDFGDGAIDYIASPSHYYSESDCYPVTLRITDGNNTTQLTKEVCVNSCGSGSDGGFPECNVNGPSFAAPGQQIILTANGIGVGPFTYSWNVFGLDATIINGIFSPTVELLLSENLSNGDVLEISVDITDASGYSVNCYYPITASGNIPALEALVWSSFEPNEYLYFVGNIDYFNLVGAYNFHFQILNTSGQVIDTYSSGFEFWNYFDGLPTGVYQICVDVTDEVGTYSDCTGFTIGNPAPVDPTPKIELVYMEQIPVLNQYAQSSDYILPEDLEGEAYRLNPENPAVFVWYKTNSYPFSTWVCDDEQKMIIHWRIRDAETGEVLLNAEDIGESNYDCQGDPAIRYIGLNTIDGCFSGSILIDATFYQSESRQQVPPYTTNTDCCPYINLSSNGTGEPNETPYHTDPIRIDIDQGSPEIQNISVASSINNNCNQILTTNVTGGCRMSQSTGAPCYTTQYYEQYSWKIYNILTGEEIEDFLIDNNTTPSNKKCVEIDPSHSFFDDFTTGETPVVKVELQVIDHAGYTAEYSKILSLRIPLKLNPVSSFTRCKGTSASLFSEPYISGGVLPYELSWDSSPYLDVSSNPLNPVLTIPNNFSGTIILGFEGRDAANCSIEHREITINVTDGIQVHPYPLPFATNTPLVTCLYESRRTLGRPDEYGGVATGGSGNYTYEWSPAIGLSNTYEAHPTVAIIPPVSEQNYTLIVTDDTGCTATGDVNVIANEISQVVANAGLDQTVCYDENSETGALLGGNPLYSGVSFASDITWEFDVDGLETYTTMDDQLQIINTDVPGEHTFTLTVIDINNGCFDQDEVKLTILDQWRYTGFNSEIDILRQGQEGNLWQEYGGTESIILSGAVSPLEYEWNPSTENNNLVVWTLDNGIPSSGKFTPTIENPELNLLVTDVFGCQKEFKSNRYILIENKPVVSITSDPQSGVFCKNQMVCFTTEVTFEPVSTNTWLLPPSIPVNHELWIHYANSFNSLEFEETNQLLHSGSLNTYLNEICIGNPFGTLVGGLNGNYGTFNSLSGLNDQTPFFGELYFLSSDNYSWNQAEEIVCDDTPPWASNIGEVSNKSVFADVVKIERNENCNQLYVPNDDIAPLYENYSGRFEGRLQGRGQVIITNLEVDEGAYFHALINPCYVEGVALKEQPNTTIEEQKKKYQVDKKSKNIGSFPSLTAYPNPFYGKTTIVYSTIAEKDKVTLELLDYTGQHIRFLEQNKICYKGVHSYTLDANELPVGLYFVSLHINDVIVDAIKIIAIID